MSVPLSGRIPKVMTLINDDEASSPSGEHATAYLFMGANGDRDPKASSGGSPLDG
jgi:hypothetical protein